MELKEKYTNRKDLSEEVSVIIERMPVKFGLWAAGIVTFIVILTSIFGWIIRYPDVISGQIVINAQNSSVKLYANSSGKIWLLGVKPQQLVKEGSYIAIIQNSANNNDIKLIWSLVSNFNINDKYFVGKNLLFPMKVSLGEINIKYYAFLNSMQKLCNYQDKNNYQKKEENLLQYIKKQTEILDQNLILKKIKDESLLITQKALKRDSSMRSTYSSMAVSEDEFERTQMNWLNANEGYQNLSKEISSIQLQITDAQNKLEQNRIEKEDNENQMYLDLLSAYNELLDNLKFWEQKYVFKAPFTGKVEYLKFWSNDQYIQAGEEAFTIVPVESKLLGQVKLPAFGAGKVKTGCKVIIKLDNYPYLEYGSIKGTVKSISLTTNTIKSLNQNEIEVYLVLVELPEELNTNYGSKLQFKYEIKGTAEIITKERRLVERLFDNLKYRISKY